MKYCGMCGALLARICAQCGFANPADFRFCGMCGKPLDRGEAPPLRKSEGLLVEVGSPAIRQLSDLTPPGAAPTPVAPALEGERRVVTVIITDVFHSTNLLEQLGNESWVELMNQVLLLQEAEIYRLGGEVDQFRGDGLLAFFGSTVTHEDDPERAILAALSIQREVKKRAADLAEQEIHLSVRIGIHTGEVIVAKVGEDGLHREDTAMGKAITLAARLEASAEPGTVLVSDATHRLVEAEFQWEHLGEISMKGLSQPVAVYRPLALKADFEERSPTLGHIGFSLPMVTRLAEFEKLKTAADDLAKGRGGIVVLSGETGMGKSFIITGLRHIFARQEALLAQAHVHAAHEHEYIAHEHGIPESGGDGQGGITFFHGRCRSYNATQPYALWLDLLQDWLGCRYEFIDQNELLGCLHDHCQDLWQDRTEEFYPYLASLFSLPLEDRYSDRMRYLQAEGLREQYSWALRNWVQKIAQRAPLVFIFSDLQWADSSSIDVLKYCLTLADSESMLWLFEMRPDRNALSWEFRQHLETLYPHRLTVIDLLPFDLEQSNQLIDGLIGPGVLTDAVRNLIIRNAEGNPYYLIELIRSLVENGCLVYKYETGLWHLERDARSLELPGSLQRLMQARIDRLASETRQVLQVAAAIGTIFWQVLLSEFLRTGENDVSVNLYPHLASLQRANLISERGRSPLGMEYIFNSDLIRETAYESLLRAQQANLHLKIAEYLEQWALTEKNRQYDGLIAYHYHQAGNPRKELFYTLQAAEQARLVYANAEALEHCNRAKELLENIMQSAEDEAQRYAIRGQIFEVLNMRSSLHYALGDIEAGDADAQALLPLAEQMSDDVAWSVDALLKNPSVNRSESRDSLISGVEMAEKALSLSRQIGDKHREMHSLATLARFAIYLRRPDGFDLAENALRLARELGDLRSEVTILLGIGYVFGMDNLERANHYLQLAQERCQEINDPRIELELLAALSSQYERSGDYYRLLTEYLQKRLEITRKIGDRFAEAFALMFVAQTQGLYLGDYEPALSKLEESFQMSSRLNSRLYPLLRIIQLQTAMGLLPQALSRLGSAQPIAEREIDEIGRAGFGLVAAILYNAVGDEDHHHQALNACQRVIEMSESQLVSLQYKMAALSEAGEAYLGLASLTGQADLRQEYHHKAIQSTGASLDIYNQFGFVQLIECTSELIFFRHSRALAVYGNRAESQEYLEKAYWEMQRKLELIPEASSYRQTFLSNIQAHQDIHKAYRKLRRAKK